MIKNRYQAKLHANMLIEDTDICIVGSGPAALSVLSALNEPHSQLSPDEYNRRFHKKGEKISYKEEKCLRVCIVSSSGPLWLKEWEDRFDAMNIKYLRSPASAHPDMFSSESLLNFAHQNNRMDELIDVGVRSSNEFYGNGRITDIDSGLFDIPSSALYLDFCRDLASKLPHRFIEGRVTGFEDEYLADSSKGVQVQVSDRLGRRYGHVTARKVVIATGFPGPNHIPPVIHDNVPESFFTHTNDVFKLKMIVSSATPLQCVLVVGGGLSAVQAAIALSKRGAKVLLLSRKPILWRHFDLPLCWFDPQMRNKSRYEFLSQEVEDRPDFIRCTRRGGTVPPWYRKQLEKSDVEQYIGEVTFCAQKQCTLQVQLSSVSGSTRIVDAAHVILATGCSPNLVELPLIAALHKKWPIRSISGLPLIEENLQWTPTAPVYIAGSLAALRSGPDAANLMGARRCARIIADDLGVYNPIQYDYGRADRNIYAAFEDTDDDDDDDSIDDSSIGN